MSTQFRSYDFVPRVAAYLTTHKEVVSEELSIEEIQDAPHAVWWVDNFGNCKTALLKEEIEQGSEVDTKFGNIRYFERLKDVPDSTIALITGSSGIGSSRFIELVAQGESAALKLTISSGDMLS